MKPCYCGSNLNYQECCQPIHNDVTLAKKPEQLMRARYSAHLTKNVDFVVATYHPNCHAEQDRQAIADSVNSDWARLEVINSEDGLHENEGYVSFRAFLRENGMEYCLAERSRFLFENGQWFYVDGEIDDSIPPKQLTAESSKVGRNDPCPCGSGKKHKKCCG
ncbi:SEC-C domain-containing protein [Vibrio sp. SCSIO 43140]|uniref:YchJ family metal-binding protein n=1 Tax=Vibrio TaxID=662 RepID=UPI0020754B6F|nr:YchJ family metal-binding protein [Vibrio sp. SCSIO 43140]USD61523.1 SEC-C domain-containing protein [Vibrio sp. SCSIO 43140]